MKGKPKRGVVYKRTPTSVSRMVTVDRLQDACKRLLRETKSCQADLAVRIGVSYFTLNRWLNSEKGTPIRTHWGFVQEFIFVYDEVFGKEPSIRVVI